MACQLIGEIPVATAFAKLGDQTEHRGADSSHQFLLSAENDASSKVCSLFVAKRLDWINTGCSTSGQVAGESGRDRHHHRSHHYSKRVSQPNAVYLALDKRGGSYCCWHPCADPGADKYEGLPSGLCHDP